MSTPALSGGFERFSLRADVAKTKTDIEESLASFNEAMSYASDSYDSLVLFSHEGRDPIATPIVSLDGFDVAPSRHYFRDDNVLDRRLMLRGTAIGDVLLAEDIHKRPQLSNSKANKDYAQQVYTHPLSVEDSRWVGAIQSSYTAEGGRDPIEIPDEGEIQQIWDRCSKELAHVAQRLLHLQELGHETGATLPAGLEFMDPIVPNSFIIRLDMEGSTAAALGRHKPQLDAYLNQVHQFVAALTAEYTTDPEKSSFNIRNAYDNQGDGAYIILPIPGGFNTYDMQVLKDYRKYIAPRFMGELMEGLQKIGISYAHDLRPKMNIVGDFAYAEADSNGRLNASTMYALAAEQKEK